MLEKRPSIYPVLLGRATGDPYSYPKPHAEPGDIAPSEPESVTPTPTAGGRY